MLHNWIRYLYILLWFIRPDIWVALIIIWHFTTLLTYRLCTCFDVLRISEISCIIWRSRKKKGAWEHAASVTVLVSRLAFLHHQESPVSSCSSWCNSRHPVNPVRQTAGSSSSVMRFALPGGTVGSSCPKSPPSLVVTWEQLSWKHSTCSIGPGHALHKLLLEGHCRSKHSP